MVLSCRFFVLMSLEDKFVKKTQTYTGEVDDMVKYLENLWSSNYKYLMKNVKYNSIKKDINVSKFQDNLISMSDNLVFRGNFGAYNDKLEKELSLNKKSIILSKDNCILLYQCFHDLFRNNTIRESLFRKIKNADIFIKHKKNEPDIPSNFRFLSNHHKLFKIIDKFWTNSLISVLKENNRLPDKNIVRNNFNREFSMSIRDLALEKLNVYAPC